MRTTFEESTPISPMTRRSKVRKGKLPGVFRDVWTFCIEGTTNKGRWTRVHRYDFTTNEGDRTFNLRVTEHQKESEPDPVFDVVIQSLRLKK